MMASDTSSSSKCFLSRSLDHTCGSIFEGINAVISALCATKPLSTVVGQRSTTVGLQLLYCEVCLQNIRIFARFGDIQFVGIRILILAIEFFNGRWPMTSDSFS